MIEEETLGPEEKREISRFRRALSLENNFAFHVIVADTKLVLDAALERLGLPLQTIRPRPPRELLSEEASTKVLSEINHALEQAHNNPFLVDALVAHQEPAWILVFRRLNELRNGIERRHHAPFLLAVLPEGETVLGQQAPDLYSKRGSGMRLHGYSKEIPENRVPAASELLAPPTDPAAFESLCLEIFREIWNDPGAQKFGRTGQIQNGVDIYGRSGSRRIGVQCKVARRSSLSVTELITSVARAENFRPPLDTYIVATTGSSDDSFTEVARRLSESAGFLVEVWAWDRLWRELSQRPELLNRVSARYWPRAPHIATSRLTNPIGGFFGREAELVALENAWKDPRVHVLCIVGWGGVGKTALVRTWVASLSGRDFDEADFFDWSFYSQGAHNQSTASADMFVDAALRFFGDSSMADSAQGAWEKGWRLAQLAGQRRALLVLDGIEPLLQPPGPFAGELKDQAMSALLRGLASKNNGLCVVTTREPIRDLAPYLGKAVSEWPLPPLSVEAGVDLLRALQVTGSEAELEEAVDEMAGHALTLRILGRFLVRAHNGDVRKRESSKIRVAAKKIFVGRHCFRVLDTYEHWLEAGDNEARLQQLAVLRLFGLFDRPASPAFFAALRARPAISGLTEPLVDLDQESWDNLVSGLVDTDIVLRDGQDLDVHPLVREYFASRLQSRLPLAWHEAHGRLFDYLSQQTEQQPESLAGLQPLYLAVYHGCQAGRHDAALNEVYFPRIMRGNQSYSMIKIGAVGTDLSAIACFFELPWSRVSPSLSEADRAWLLNQAAFHLRALGRLREAVEPMRAILALNKNNSEWRNCAVAASNLSELELTLGEVQAAVVDAEQSVAFADRSGDAFLRMDFRTALADARHQAGEEGAALALFREAEVLQAERQPQYPLLYSLAGFRYCDLLLAPAERAAGSGHAGDSEGILACTEVERRAVQTLEWATLNRLSLLDLALDNLSFGRALLYSGILSGRKNANEAKDRIEQAVSSVRAAGRMQHVPQVLITRAWLRGFEGDLNGSRADLDEAREIAERGGMALHLADTVLLQARLFHDSAALAEARRLVTVHGYGRRLSELADLEAAAMAW